MSQIERRLRFGQFVKVLSSLYSSVKVASGRRLSIAHPRYYSAGRYGPQMILPRYLSRNSSGRLVAQWFGLIILAVTGGDLWAATTILSNQTPHTILAEFPHDSGGSHRVTLHAKEVVPLPIRGMVSFDYWIDGKKFTGTLRPNTIYQFLLDDLQQVKLHRLDMGGPKVPRQGNGKGTLQTRRPGVLKIKIAVDEDEKTRRPIWEKKLRDRIEAASRLLEIFTGMRLEVTVVSRWQSNNEITSFDKTLHEFTQEVPAAPAQLVIGFTSQYSLRRGRSRLGGTFGPLQRHILIREYGPQIGEAERLEVLLHELGHYLGAAHSVDKSSLMRPVLGDDQANRRSFRVVYDPVNMLIMNLVSERMRRHGSHTIISIPVADQERLLGLYQWLAKAQAGDSSANRMAAVLCRDVLGRTQEKKVAPEVRNRETAVERTIRLNFQKSLLRVINAVNREAESRRDRSLVGDRLTEAYVRAAAAAAVQLPPQHALRAFFLGLAVALDRGALIRRYESVAALIRIQEDLVQRARRDRLIGSPTLRDRTGLLQHFLAAALLTTLSGPETAESVTLVNELNDAEGITGFRFADVMANIAGIRFSRSLHSGEVKLSRVAREFTVDRFIPPAKGWSSSWTDAELEEEYGGIRGKEFREEIEKIRKSVNRLPPYRLKAIETDAL